MIMLFCDSGCSISAVTTRTFLALPVSLLLCLGASAQPAPPQQAPAQSTASVPAVPPAWTEHYRKATVAIGRIVTIEGKERFEVIGAGVLASPESTTVQHVFLVTAKHVFSEPAQNWHPSELRLRFSSQESKSFTEELGFPLRLTKMNGENLWSALSDDSDIAIIPFPISIPYSLRGVVTDVIGIQDFANPDDVYDGASVFVFGYPSDATPLIRQDGLVRAITRSGSIAWTDPNGAVENPLLLDSNILPGNSGGPAFKVPSGLNKAGSFVVGGRIAYLGVVTATLQHYYVVQADGRVVQVKYADLPLPSIAQVQIVGIGGLGKVEPAAKVKKLMDAVLNPKPAH